MNDRNDIPASFTAAVGAEIIVLIAVFVACAVVVNGRGILGIFASW